MHLLLAGLIALFLTQVPSQAADDARLAYVISIEEYNRPTGPIKRGSGADTMAAALADFGYTVQRYKNINKWEFEAVLKESTQTQKGPKLPSSMSQALP